MVKNRAFHLTKGVIIEGNIGNLMKAVITSVGLVVNVYGISV